MGELPEAETKPINILVVGETQHGKSTFIKSIADYAGVSDLDIEIGTGSRSCTKAINEYHMDITVRDYQLVNNAEQPIIDMSYEELCDLRQDDARPIELLEDQSCRSTFNFIDTPGLNDTHGDDLINMARLVGYCNDLTHLNALIYLKSIEEPYSRSFKDFFHYLQRCLPTFSRGFIIVHTHVSTRRVREHLADNVDIYHLHRKAFEQAFNLGLEHFFLDSQPSHRSTFARLQSRNEISRVLRHLQSQKAMPSTGFRLLKTPSMLNVDMHVRNALNELKLKLEREQTKDKGIADTFAQIGHFHKVEIGRLRTRISTIWNQINSLNNGPDVVLGAKSVSEDYSFYSLFRGESRVPERPVEYVADYQITEVRKSKSSGSRWTNETRKNNTWSAMLSGATFRGLSGTATFYTSSAIRNQEAVKVFQTMAQELEDSIVAHEEAIKRSGMSTQFNESALQAGENLGKIDNMLAALDREEFELALWPSLRSFYLNRGRQSKQDIQAFVRVFDQEVSSLLSVS